MQSCLNVQHSHAPQFIRLWARHPHTHTHTQTQMLDVSSGLRKMHIHTPKHLWACSCWYYCHAHPDQASSCLKAHGKNGKIFCGVASSRPTSSVGIQSKAFRAPKYNANNSENNVSERFTQVIAVTIELCWYKALKHTKESLHPGSHEV